jgi:hypothetical protein
MENIGQTVAGSIQAVATVGFLMLVGIILAKMRKVPSNPHPTLTLTLILATNIMHRTPQVCVQIDDFQLM